MVVIAVTVPASALVLYLALGSPGVSDQPLAGRLIEREAAARRQAEIERLVDRMAERLRREPGDLDGWMLLARSYATMRRFPDALDAYRRAVDLSGRDPGILSAFGEAMVMAEKGTVTAAAVRVFEEARTKDPTDARSRFFLAMAKAQKGDMRGALEDWVDMEKSAPADAPWLSAVRDHIRAAAKQLGIDPKTMKPETAATPPSKP